VHVLIETILSLERLAAYNRGMTARDERLAKNEALLREVNERIHEVGERLQVLPDDELLDFRCECGRLECDDPVSMTPAEYEHVRSDNDRFAVLPGHEEEDIERVVERNDRYLIVDKRPEVEPYVGADGQPNSGS
jgi:hypothetical protein